MANPKPNTKGLKPFKKGETGNPGGKSSEQRRLEMENAARATRIRGRFLEALEALMSEHPEKQTLIEERLTGDVLRLIKESEDRGLGTARQSVDLSSEDGSMTPKAAVELTDEQLARLAYGDADQS